MPSINVNLDYFDHPKTRRLIGLLGRGAAELPIRLWTYCGRFHPESGSLASYSAQEIESMVGWWGKAGDAVEAMVKVGFLDQTDEGLAVHQWQEHAGHLVFYKNRAKTAAEKRWSGVKGKGKGDASSNASSSAKRADKQCLSSTTHSNAGQCSTAAGETLIPPAVTVPSSEREVCGPDAAKNAAPPPPLVKVRRNTDTPWQMVIDHIHASFLARKGVPPEWTGHLLERLRVKVKRFEPEGVIALWDEACRRMWHADRAAERDNWLAGRWVQEGHEVLFFLDRLTEYLCEGEAWKSAREKLRTKLTTSPATAAIAALAAGAVNDAREIIKRPAGTKWCRTCKSWTVKKMADGTSMQCSKCKYTRAIRPGDLEELDGQQPQQRNDGGDRREDATGSDAGNPLIPATGGTPSNPG